MKLSILVLILLNISPTLVAAENIKPKKAQDYSAITKRDIFWPLWKSSQKTPEQIEADRKREEETRKSEQEEKLSELRRQEETRKQEALKKQLVNALSLTGIVNDGTQLVAFVQNRKQGNKTVVLKKGDTIEDSTVIDIDQNNSEVILEHKNNFKVILTLRNP